MKDITIFSKTTIILFDIDDTLIVGSNLIYLNDAVRNKIHSIQRSDVQIGISTNRSYDMAWPVYVSLSLDGPLLIEKGANYVFRLYNPVKRSAILLTLVAIRLLLMARASVGGFSVDISRKRKYSLSIKLDSTTQFDSMARFVNNILNYIPYFESTYAPRSGRVYIGYRYLTKNYAIEKLLNTYRNIYVIGDSEHDAASQSIHYLGVFNSDEDYKRICEYSTSKTDKDGIIDLLSYVYERVSRE